MRHVAHFSLVSLRSFSTLFIILLWLFTLIIPHKAVSAADGVKWSEVPIPAQGSPGRWVLAPGSDIQHLTMAIDGKLYAYGKGLTYTLYKSTDNGASWSFTGNVQQSIVAIAASPQNAGTIYYATASTVYKSTDGGKTFSPLPPNPGGAGSGNIEITSLAVTHHYSTLIAVGTQDKDNAQFGGVYLLDEQNIIPAWTDTGLTGYDVFTIAFSPHYAGDRSLVAVATDELDTFVTMKVDINGWGATYGNARLNRDNAAVPSPVVVANSAEIVFPDDYDATFADFTLFAAIDTGTGNGDVYRVTAAPAPGTSVAVDLNIGAAYGLNNIDVTGLAISGTAPGAKLLAGAANSAQVYFSADGGKTWVKSRKEPTGTRKTFVLMSPDFDRHGLAFAATSGSDSAFSVSSDGGTSWNQPSLIDTTMTAIVDLAPSPDYSQDATIFMITFGGSHSLWRTRNGGAGWERILSSSLFNTASFDLVKLPPQYRHDFPNVYLAGSIGGRPALWKSADGGQAFMRRFIIDPDTSADISVNTWEIVNESTLLIGSFDGAKGRIYRTANSGFSYAGGAYAGTLTPASLLLSPHYDEDGTILMGNTGGWVYWSQDKGASFEPLPPNAASPPLTGTISVAFDPDFRHNRTVYAASTTADKGIYRFIIGKSTAWERIDGTLPAGGTINQLRLSTEGVLYAADSLAGAGIERCLNPAYILGPTFETVTRGLGSTSSLTGLWAQGHRLWSIDAMNVKLMTLNDTLTAPVSLRAPVKNARGVGTLLQTAINNVALDWEAVLDATTYRWQIDSDTDFSSVPAGFEGTTQASTVSLPPLVPGTTYHWRVRVTEPVLSPWSEKWYFSTSLATDTAALKLDIPVAGATGVSVRPLFQWQAVAGAESYELLVAQDAFFSQPVVTRVGTYALPTTAWQSDISLDYSTTYYWKVRATGNGTTSAWSAASVFTTEPRPAETRFNATNNTAPLVVIQPAIQPLPQFSPPTPPPPTAPQTEAIPDWLLYLIGTLLLTNVLLVITLLIMVITLRRS